MKISPQIADWNNKGQNASVCTIKANSMNVFITLGKLLLQEVGDDSILI